MRRFLRERRNFEFTVQGQDGITPGVLVWGSIDIGYRSRLVFIGGRLNAHRYIDEILGPILLPLINYYRSIIFQQDNARPHIANITRHFLQQTAVEIFFWPARLPGLNPYRTCVGKYGSTLETFALSSKHFERTVASPTASLGWDTSIKNWPPYYKHASPS